MDNSSELGQSLQLTDQQWLNEQEQILRLALWRAPGVGPVTYRKALKCWQVNGPVDVQAKLTDQHLGASLVKALPEKALAFMKSQPLIDLVAKDLEWASGAHQQIIFQEEPDYPVMLAGLLEAPPLLFVLGDIEALQTPQLAMVGTRNPTAVGQQMSRDFAKELVGHQLTVTSGLALGVDGCAHQGAVQAAGKTIAVLANGLDQVYPKRHQSLAKQIISNKGALVSEFPIGIAPRREHFPRRNRIISGLSYGVLVVEAALQSGSLITARLAAQQGREAFAIPGPIHNPMSKGCHQLLREGAVLVETIQDITEVVLPLLKRDISSTADAADTHVGQEDPVLAEPLSPQERSLLAAMEFEVMPLDELVIKSEMTTQEVLTHLMTLELKDQVITTVGGYQKVTSF